MPALDAVRPPDSRQGSYGVDAPILLVFPILLVVYSLVQGVLTRSPWPFIGAGLIVISAMVGFHTSKRGKFVVWNELLDDLRLDGNEHLLDVGCGRGAILMLAAQHLPKGRATGVDLWRKRDQAGNDASATMANAEAEGVADRVEVHTADMTDLPFADDSFDIVLSNVAIHNVATTDGRSLAIDEAVRVLRPGGRLLVADLRRIGEYRDRLVDINMKGVEVRNLGWRMWWSGPWLPTILVTATKPAT